MEKELTFAVEEIRHIDASEYDSDDYMLARIKFLSTRPNSHGIVISEDVLKSSANTVLGKWVTGEVLCGDCTTHTDGQVICGIVPKEQDIEFVEADDGYLDAYVDCIISKRYAKQYCNIFSEEDDARAVSVEAAFNMKDDNEAESFDIKTITTLGRNVRPSVPGAGITITRFSEQDAEEYYRMSQANSLSKLKTFVEERKINMAKKKYASHPINTSKDAIYTGDWDGDKAKQDLIREKNYKSLAPKVCLKLEEGWENREVTKLGYPVMGLYDGEWRYSSKAIASAHAYAERNDEAEVLNKIERIYKKLDINKDSQGKEEDAKMSKEIEFAAVDIGDLWGRVWDAIHAKYPDGEYGCAYRIEGIYEEDNKKFAIIRHRDEDSMYRLDLSLTEDGLTIADEIVKVELDIIETDTVKKFAEPENAKCYTEFEDIDDGDKDDDDDEKDEDPDNDDGDDDEDNEVKMSEDEMMEKIHQLEKDIEEKEHIIMANEDELKELREFKQARLEADRAKDVESVMAEIKEYLDEGTYTELRQEGLMCEFSEIDAWANKAKAQCFNLVKGTKPAKKSTGGIWGFSAPIESVSKKKSSIWDD